MKVGIALCTYEPDYELLAAQIASIQFQTWKNFVCIIYDDGSSPNHISLIRELVKNDARFRLIVGAENCGPYLAFEKCLFEVTKYDVDFIAFSDQDDVWFATKIEDQVNRLIHSGKEVTSCDLTIVDARHKVIRSSLRNGRRFGDFHSLLCSNEVAGASILLTSNFASKLLPFPKSQLKIKLFHDHWISLVASWFGTLDIDERVLYRFVQHGTNDSGGREFNDWDGLQKNLYLFKLYNAKRMQKERNLYTLGIQSLTKEPLILKPFGFVAFLRATFRIGYHWQGRIAALILFIGKFKFPQRLIQHGK